MGYTNVRHYSGGIAEWMESGEPIERDSAPVERAHIRIPILQIRRSTIDRAVAFLGNMSFDSLLAMWLVLVLGCGLIYWMADRIWPMSLMERGTHMDGLAS